MGRLCSSAYSVMLSFSCHVGGLCVHHFGLAETSYRTLPLRPQLLALTRALGLPRSSDRASLPDCTLEMRTQERHAGKVTGREP